VKTKETMERSDGLIQLKKGEITLILPAGTDKEELERFFQDVMTVLIIID
jgi:hypothetical protein